MNELDYSYATQRIRRTNKSIIVKGREILNYVGGMIWNIGRLETSIQQGSVFIDKSKQIEVITNEEDIERLGYCITSEAVEKGGPFYFSGQKRFYDITKKDTKIKGQQMPEGHHVEYDVLNKTLRLIGKGAGRFGAGLRLSLNPQIRNEHSEVLSGFFGEQKKEEIKTILINEMPVMITNNNELLCIPNLQDEPTIGIIGLKGSGKTFLQHAIADRAVNKFRKSIAVLNDSSNQCASWSKPWYADTNSNDKNNIFCSKLRSFGECTIPQPIVLLTPKTSSSRKLLPNSGISFEISFSFKDLITDYQFYLEGKKEWSMASAGRYMRLMMSELIKCRTFEQIEETVFNHLNKKGDRSIREAILSRLKDIFDRHFLDVDTGVASKWKVVFEDGSEKFYSPTLACLICGLVPVINTSDLIDKDYFHQYFRYIVHDIFNAQVTDQAFLDSSMQIWLFVDELQRISSTKQQGLADEILERCVTEGRPNRIGFVYATQNFSGVLQKIRWNTTYLFCFHMNSRKERSEIGGDYGLSEVQQDKIGQLEKFEVMALTSEKFIVYDSDGKRRPSEPNEFFIGKALPPLSQHKPPRDL